MFSSGNQHAKRCQGKPNMIDQDFHPQWIVRSFKEAITRGGIHQFGFTFQEVHFWSIKGVTTTNIFSHIHGHLNYYMYMS